MISGEDQKPIKINEELLPISYHIISYLALERKSNHHVDVAENSEGYDKIFLYLVADKVRHAYRFVHGFNLFLG